VPNYETWTDLDWQREMAKCADSFVYFAGNYLRVVDRDSTRLVPLNLKAAQKRILEARSRHGVTYVLKPRRTGGSVAVMSRQFHRVLFTANHQAITVAHDDEATLEMFKVVRSFYDGLPPKFKQAFPLKSDRSDQLYFKHGGAYRVGSIKSRGLVGGATINDRHYAEFAKYGGSVKNPEDAIAYIEGGSTAGGRVVYDTTAEGLGYAHDAWKAPNGWHKLFLPWTIDAGYRVKTRVVGGKKELVIGVAPIPRTRDELLFPEVVTYAQHYGLDDEQAQWVGFMLLKGGISELDPSRVWREFHRDYPITADVAWTVARGRVFRERYDNVWPRRGPRRFLPPEKYRAYVMGVDTASGREDGDFSAIVILDVTDPSRPRMAWTFYDKIDVPEFSKVVCDAAREYGAFIVPERNNNGLDVINRLKEYGYGHIYREQDKAKIGAENVERLGFYTGANTRPILVNLLQDFLNGGKLDPMDERLKYEINDFQWTEKDRAEAVAPNHDDLLFALALALVGRKGVTAAVQEKLGKRPITLQERIEWRRQTGKQPGSTTFDDDLDDEDFDASMGSAWDLAHAGNNGA
jgi:hypothetical protein